MLSAADLQREAEATGFRGEALEKVVRLLELLEGIRSHPFLKHRVALKGGTALNLFVFQVPRLSVDIDLNYIGAVSRDVMLAERPKVEQAIQAVCGRAGMQIKRVPDEHAGGKWRLSYRSASGRSGTLEVDVNFLLRPLASICASAAESSFGSSMWGRGRRWSRRASASRCGWPAGSRTRRSRAGSRAKSSSGCTSTAAHT